MHTQLTILKLQKPKIFVISSVIERINCLSISNTCDGLSISDHSKCKSSHEVMCYLSVLILMYVIDDYKIFCICQHLCVYPNHFASASLVSSPSAGPLSSASAGLVSAPSAGLILSPSAGPLMPVVQDMIKLFYIWKSVTGADNTIALMYTKETLWIWRGTDSLSLENVWQYILTIPNESQCLKVAENVAY